MTPHEAETTFAPVPFDPGRPPGPQKPPKRKHNRDAKTQPPSKADMCLLAIARLEDVWQKGGAPKSAIVVEVWQANDPFAFGLSGYEESHPDSNRVIMELVKMKSHGLIRQPKENHYALTLGGRTVADRLAARRA